MTCKIELHNEFVSMGEIIFPFCNEEIQQHNSTSTESCCADVDLIEDCGRLVCIKCGQVNGFYFDNEYIDFHENMYRIRKKSVYIRKYHVENVINKYNKEIQLSFQDRNKIYEIFTLMNNVLPEVDQNRKRMIS